jgi:hypothetical protein
MIHEEGRTYGSCWDCYLEIHYFTFYPATTLRTTWIHEFLMFLDFQLLSSARSFVLSCMEGTSLVMRLGVRGVCV